MIVYLPTVNATLNATSAILLAFGYAAIRRKHVRRHRALMLSAVGVSILFLISYVVYHTLAKSTPFPGKGWVRPAYLTMLATHIVLAACLVPLVGVTLVKALRGRFETHRRWARWTLPIWFYVSVTGVLVYVVLYVIYGARPVLSGS